MTGAAKAEHAAATAEGMAKGKGRARGPRGPNKVARGEGRGRKVRRPEMGDEVTFAVPRFFPGMDLQHKCFIVSAGGSRWCDVKVEWTDHARPPYVFSGCDALQLKSAGGLW